MYLTYSHVFGVSPPRYLHSVLHLHHLRYPEWNEQVQKKSTEPLRMQLRQRYGKSEGNHRPPIAQTRLRFLASSARGTMGMIAVIRPIFTGTTRGDDVLGKLRCIDNCSVQQTRLGVMEKRDEAGQHPSNNCNGHSRCPGDAFGSQNTEALEDAIRRWKRAATVGEVNNFPYRLCTTLRTGWTDIVLLRSRNRWSVGAYICTHTLVGQNRHSKAFFPAPEIRPPPPDRPNATFFARDRGG
ncbi:hypothetical protein EDC04DRAFT_3095162 [Pisolithus marmoratus]|nr:hypothetical protein EDC04DRAFT_3095162 [Pisolithus marmoratus]